MCTFVLITRKTVGPTDTFCDFVYCGHAPSRSRGVAGEHFIDLLLWDIPFVLCEGGCVASRCSRPGKSISRRGAGWDKSPRSRNPFADLSARQFAPQGLVAGAGSGGLSATNAPCAAESLRRGRCNVQLRVVNGDSVATALKGTGSSARRRTETCVTCWQRYSP